jgi:hypothetical protein
MTSHEWFVQFSQASLGKRSVRYEYNELWEHLDLMTFAVVGAGRREGTRPK